MGSKYMKEAIMALDGGGSNLRMVVADKETNEEIYFRQIKTGTNLSTVPNKEEALENITIKLRNKGIVDEASHLKYKTNIFK